MSVGVRVRWEGQSGFSFLFSSRVTYISPTQRHQNKSMTRNNNEQRIKMKTLTRATPGG